MKKSLVLIFAVTLFYEHLVAQVVKNAGFETGTLSGWTFTNPAYFGFAKEPGYKASVVKSAAAKGTYAARLASTGNSQWAQLKQSVDYKPVDSFERVRLSGYVKVTGVKDGSAGISIAAFRDDDIKLNAKDTSLKGSRGWTKISVDLVIVQATDSLTLFCSLVGHGEVLFDDLRIEKLSAPKFAQSAEAKAYLDTALAIIDTYALYKDSVDFTALLSTARLLAGNAKTPADCYPAIEFALKGLHDRHSFFRPAKVMTEPEDINPDIQYPEGKLLAGSVGYVRIPKFGYSSDVLKLKYADSLQRILQSIDRKDMKGWIVDVRKNGGGQPYAMLLGVAPILGEGVFMRSK